MQAGRKTIMELIKVILENEEQKEKVGEEQHKPVKTAWVQKNSCRVVTMLMDGPRKLQVDLDPSNARVEKIFMVALTELQVAAGKCKGAAPTAERRFNRTLLPLKETPLRRFWHQR
ncbi:hypothetical protein HAX54_013900 [Datura stramonium]|uniref:Uncharacterized protein n=1 Tax=Datura stramonium TaxID=4076 RepID=A0ABS8TM42_DATST|nr:hypothetical protein [Datura stramonium]